MAVVRARSSPPYALISFITLWVVSTVLAILFYLQYTKADKALADYTGSMSKTARPDEIATLSRQIIADIPSGQSPAPSLLAASSKENGDLKTLLVGNANAPLGTIRAAVADAQALGGPSQPLVAKVRALAADITRLTGQYTQTKAELDGLNAKVAAQSASDNKIIESKQAEIEAVTKQLKDSNDQLVAARAAMTAASEKNQADITASAERAEATHRSDVLALDAKDSNISHLEQQIKELRIRLVNLLPTNNPTVGTADGSVTIVNSAAKECYIDLHGPGVTAGLTFTVYDSRTGVRFGTDDESLGKGSIEVIQPGERNTLCSIKRITKGQSIAPGDVISNLVFDANKNRKQHFVIFGDFDLDGDGVATADERDRLASLVTKWGGIIDPEVNSQTDYLIVGSEPKSPSINADAPPATGSAASQRTTDQDKYQALIIEAKRLSIPVLNANRFLNMIGYYSTTIVRH